MAEDLGDKTEAPSARRLFEARDRGNIARSADLAAAIVLTAAAVVLASFGADMMGGLGSMMRVELSSGAGDLSDDLATVGAHLRQTALRGVILAAPVVALLAVAAYAAHFIQVGWLFTTKPLEPQLSRLNLLKGLGQIFSQRNLVKSVASVLKLAGIVAVSWVLVGREAAALAALPGLTAAAGFVHMFALVLRLSLWILLFLGVLGLGDYLYQKWKHSEDLKMTKQEVKEERKTSDGDPEVKARRMRIARQIAMQRLRADVPKADVVVTNPTHYAVALRYDSSKMRAPKVVAKGADYLALQIRTIAAQSGVPIVERAPLARALFRSVKVGQEIPAEQYEAVAEVLAYVYRLEGRRAG